MTEVYTEDYHKYVFECFEKAKLRKAEYEKRYNQKKLEYDNKFFNKLFNWKYEKSFSSIDDAWDFYIPAVKSWEDELARVIYYQKHNHIFVHIGKDICERSFFKWCKQNNIPH